ncbi:hypothetical protein V500_10352 [Pseudogymnoascus sp. VKM F-4518 (FW-2643)]|nr:hypothetical protein V500_10352 [Pseudogymnoascus sp. VKM F-4518 (FW-2643)]
MILVILAILLFWKIASFFYTVQLDCAERGGLLCWNTPPLIRDIGIRDVDISEIDVGVISGRDIPPNCEGPLEGVAAGQELEACGREGDGVCVVRSCPGVGAVADAVADAVGQDTSPPTEELAGTPTVDKASSWWRQTQRVQDGGAACTGGQKTISSRHSQTPWICDPDDGTPPLAGGIQLDDWDADGDADGGDPAADECGERGAEGGDARGGVEFVCFFCGVVGACGDWGGGYVASRVRCELMEFLRLNSVFGITSLESPPSKAHPEVFRKPL